MDFKQLRSFIAVIKYGSFTTAANKLRISQPTVSTHIRTLEEELGTPLVLRNAKRVELTPSGYKMYDQAESMLAMHDRMLQSMKHRETDAIYLGASSIPSGYILPRILANYCKLHPQTRFVISQDSSQSVVDGMLTGLYDLGFVDMPVKEDTLDSMPFCGDKIVIAAANNEHFQEIDSDSKEAIAAMLKSENIIMRKSGSATRETSNRILDELGVDEAELNVVAHLDDQESIKNLVERGLGISMMSEHAVQARVSSGWLKTFDVPGVDTTRQFYLLRRKSVALSVQAEDFSKYVLTS